MYTWIVAILLAAFGIWALSVNWSIIMGAPFVPTSFKRVNKMLKLAKVTSDDIIYDLGSGDGRIVIMAAKKYHVKKAVGIEIDPVRIVISNILVLLFGVRKRVKIVAKNMFKVDMSDATVITCFMLPDTNEELFAKLNVELKPGTRVVTNRFEFPHWRLLDEDNDTYLYKVMDFHGDDY